MKYTVEVSKFKNFNWHHSLSVKLLEYGQYLVAELIMFYDPQLSAEVLRQYLPLNVVERVLKALEKAADRQEVEIDLEFDSRDLPMWPWKPDAKALNEAYIFPGNSEKPGTLLTFVEDGFRLKIEVEGSIERYFPTELAWMAEKLRKKLMSNPMVWHGVIREEETK